MEAFKQYHKSPNQDTLIRLLKACQNSVFNIAFQVLRQRQDAEDVSQQVLMKICDKCNQINEPYYFKQWLYRVTFNTALNFSQKRLIRKKHEGARAMTKEYDTSSIPQESVETIQEHIGKLNDDLKCLVVEHYFERKTLDELSKDRGCSTTAVWKKIEKAKTTLKHSLTQAGFAGVVPFFNPMMKSIQYVTAPSGLITKSIIAKATSVSGGVTATVLTIGGIAMKAKTIAAIAIISIAGSIYLGDELLTQSTETHIQQDISTQVKRPDKEIQKLLRGNAPAKQMQTIPASQEKSETIASNLPRHKGPQLTTYNLQNGQMKPINSNKDNDAEEMPQWEKDLRSSLGTEIRFQFEQNNLQTILEFFNQTRNIKYVVEPDAMSEAPPITLDGQRGMTVKQTLDRIMQITSLEYRLINGVIYIAKPEKIKMIETDQRIPEVVNKYLRKQRDEDLIDVAISDCLRKYDPQLAASWFETLPENSDHRSWIDQIAGNWGRKDPQAAVLWAVGLHQESEQNKAFGNIAREWAKKDLEAATAWIETLPFIEKNQTVINYFMPIFAESDPQKAAQWIELVADGEGIKNAYREIASAWYTKNSREALEWATQLPEGMRRENAFRAIAHEGAKSETNLQKMEVWLGNLPDGQSKERAIWAFSLGLARRNPEKAANWALKIKDDALRDGALHEILSIK